ncbi:putative transporter YisQ [Clostridia bacterium]|nr:putative transporter YisQ [Clostridia bacterium]
MDLKRVLRLFFPIFIEQLLGITVGAMSSIMVSGVSDAAVAGVGLINNLNFVVINMFIAVATGTTVVAAQCMGRGDAESARKASAQSLTVVTYISLALTVLLLLFARPLIDFLFGGADAPVLAAAESYLFFSALSMPFLAVYSTVGGIMRSVGEMKKPMMGGVTANIVNVAVTAAAIFGLRLGVDGAGWGLLFSRALSMALMLWMLQRGHGALSRLTLSFKLTLTVLAPVLSVAIPAAIDAIIFNGCKLLVQVFMANMGTDTLAAYSILGNMSSFVNVPGGAVSTLAMSIVANAYGAGDMKGAHRMSWRLTLLASALTAAAGAIIFVFLHPLIGLFNITDAAYKLVYDNMVTFIIITPIFWSGSFVLPNCLRSIGRQRYTMAVSIVSMVVLRVFGAWLLGVHFGMGLYGIWISMYLDWVGRSVFFALPIIKVPGHKEAA